MRRTLLTVAAGASAVLCVGVCGLSVRSYWSTDTWAWLRLDLNAGRATEFRARSERGDVRLIELTTRVAPGFYSDPAELDRLKATAGLSHSSRRAGYGSGLDYGGRHVVGRFPHRALLPPFAVLPVLWARRR